MGRVPGTESDHSIVEALGFFRVELDVDVVKAYRDLKSVGKLSIQEMRDGMSVAKALNRVGELAVKANQIFLKAKKERNLFRVEFNREMYSLRREATRRIKEDLKADGNEKKQITEKMVEEKIASDADLRSRFLTIRKREEDLREIRDNCERLSKEWTERKWTLNTQGKLLESGGYLGE